MPLLVDGNNLAYRLAGRADRATVRQKVLDFVRGRRVSVTVVFDGPPPEGTPQREILGPLTVLYSGRRSADDLIVQRIPRGAQAHNFTVITGDRELARRVRDAGAGVIPVSTWMRKLSGPAEAPEKPAVPGPLPPDEVARWERIFSGEPEGEDGD